MKDFFVSVIGWGLESVKAPALIRVFEFVDTVLAGFLKGTVFSGLNGNHILTRQTGSFIAA